MYTYLYEQTHASIQHASHLCVYTHLHTLSYLQTTHTTHITPKHVYSLHFHIRAYKICNIIHHTHTLLYPHAHCHTCICSRYHVFHTHVCIYLYVFIIQTHTCIHISQLHVYNTYILTSICVHRD